jgi:protein arginine kinase
MGHKNFFNQALSEWMKASGPESDIVISSRIRLARNLQNLPFPIIASDENSLETLNRVKVLLDSEDLNEISTFDLLLLDEMNDLSKKVLVEKHLISPALANESRNGAVILSENESISIMVNEEDHLRIQILHPGFQIKEAWDLCNQIDDIFEGQLDYAYDEQRGYLTSCPTNVGTGIRVSVMMHLPALVLTQQISRILSAISQVGLVVRGLYGEGSEATGNLFQISNQITLGQSEDDIIDNLYSVARQIVEHERAARGKLLTDSKLRTLDRVNRSYGILAHAMIIDSKEASQRLSDVRLGVDLGMLTQTNAQAINELTVMTQPGYLQQYAGEALTPDERDLRRAELIRSRLAQQ